MGHRTGGNTHHVVPDKTGGWNVIRGGGARTSSHHGLKSEAVETAREVSRAQRTELKIHNRDGRISQSDSHGGDPKPPPG